MTRAEFIKRVEHWRERIAPEWAVAVNFDEKPDSSDGDEYVAAISSNQAIMQAIMFVDLKQISAQHAKEVDRIIVHELIHPLLDVVLDMDDDLMRAYVPAASREVFRGQRRLAMEAFVNRTAQAIVYGETNQRTGTTKAVE